MSDYKIVKVELNKSGVKKVLQSDGVMSALKADADKVGNGQMFANFVGYDRCHVLVRDPNGNRTDNS